MEDLAAEIQEWIKEGDQVIVGGDLNKEIRGPAVKEFFTNLACTT